MLMLTALTLIGLLGFRATYGGHDYLIAGLTGVILGIAIGHLGFRARLPLLAVTAIGVLAFLLIGAVVAQASLGSQIPTLTTMHEVALASVHGWKQLLTTARPVGTTAHLLVLPYLLGLVCGATGCTLASRTRLAFAPVRRADGGGGAEHPVRHQ